MSSFQPPRQAGICSIPCRCLRVELPPLTYRWGEFPLWPALEAIKCFRVWEVHDAFWLREEWEDRRRRRRVRLHRVHFDEALYLEGVRG